MIQNVKSEAQSVNNVKKNKRGKLRLFQFLFNLLETETPIIEWTNRQKFEFQLINPEEVARQWGKHNNIETMNYDKLSRSLRYYYKQNKMEKINGKRYAYKFICDKNLKNSLSGKNKLKNVVQTQHVDYKPLPQQQQSNYNYYYPPQNVEYFSNTSQQSSLDSSLASPTYYNTSPSNDYNLQNYQQYYQSNYYSQNYNDSFYSTNFQTQPQQYNNFCFY